LAPSPNQRYVLLDFHARGGLGEVWHAHDVELGRRVALKRIQEARADQPESRRRFLLEAEITGRLEHPGVVPVYGLVRDAAERPCYAMRFIQGETLAEAIRQYHDGTAAGPERNVAFRELLQRFIAVCQTVGFAHSRGILHRDLKPDNVLLGKYGETLVVDWGLAKPVGRSEVVRTADEHTLTPTSGEGSEGTRVGQTVGTLGFMSPEQAGGRWDVIGPASDIYSLGAVLHVLLTNRRPIEEKDVGRHVLMVQRGEVTRPRQLKADVPAALEAICLKALATRPEERYATALALAEDVQHWLADEPVAAYREPALVRWRRWSRRHRALVTGAGAALVVAVLTLSSAAVLLNEARTQAQEQHARAESNYQLARQVVDDFSTVASGARRTRGVGEDPRQREQDLEDLRKKLFASCLTYYEKFVAQRGDDPALRADQARAFTRMAGINSALGDSRVAAEQCQRAQAIQEALVAEHPGETAYRFDLAQSLQGLYEVRDKRQADGAEEALRRVRDLAAGVAREQPDNSEYQVFHVNCHLALGELHNNHKRPAEAHAAYQKALDLYTELTKAHPEVNDYRGGLGVTYWVLGMRRADQKNHAEAEPLLRRAEALLEAAAREQPGELDYQRLLALTRWSLGMTYHHLGRAAESEQAFDQSLEVCARNAREHPSITEYQQMWAVSLLTRGLAYANAGNHAKALALLQPAAEVLERLEHDHPEVDNHGTNFRSALKLLALIFRAEGRVDEAEAVHPRLATLNERLARDHRGEPGHRFELAAHQNMLGLWYRQIGRPDKAEAAHRRSLEVYELLAREYPDVLTYAIERDGVRCNLGHLYGDVGQDKAALDQYAGAEAGLTAILGRERRQALAREYLANTLRGRISLFGRLGRQAEAIDDRKRLVVLYEEQAELGPTDAGVLHNLARAHEDLGRLYEEAGRPADAAASYQKSLLVQEKLIKAHPQVVEYTIDLGGVYCNKAHAAAAKQPQQALEWYARAEAILTGVLKQEIKPAHFRTTAVKNLRNTLEGRATLLLAQERPAEAVRDAREAAALQESLARAAPNDAEEKKRLGECLYRLGNAHRRAGQIAEAEEAHRKEVRATESTYRWPPEAVAAAVRVGGSQCNFGHFLRTNHKAPESLEWYDKALVTLQAALQQDPNHAQGAEFLGNTRLERFRALLSLRRLAEADAERDAAIADAGRLVKEKPAEPSGRAALARLHSDFGDEYRQAKMPAEAEAAYTKGAEILRDLTRGFPNDIEYADLLAECLTNCGKAYGFAGRSGAAAERLAKAAQFREQLAAGHPKDPALARRLAELNDLLALVHAANGQHGAAEKAGESAGRVWETLAREQPQAEAHLLGLAGSRRQLGYIYFLDKKTDRAVAAYEGAAAAWEQLRGILAPQAYEAHREAIEECYGHLGELYLRGGKWVRAEEAYRTAVRPAGGRKPTTTAGGCCCNLGLALFAQEKYQEALEWFDRAAGMLADVRKRAPEDATATNYLRNTCAARARTLSRLGRHRDAVASWDQAVALADEQTRTACRVGRAVARARLGDHARAAAEAVDVAGLPTLTDGDRYDLACTYALSSRAAGKDEKLAPAERERCARDYAERSIRLLEQAAENGFFKDTGKREQLKKDKDLDPVRTQDGFKKVEKRLRD
jgi:serine/threonine-protein kinase